MDIADEPSFESRQEVETFVPTVEVTIEKGMMNINSDLEMKKLMEEMSMAPVEAVVNWQKSIGYTSFMTKWYDVMIAEDRLNDSLEALPESIKALIDMNDIQTSEEHDKALEQGFIKYIEDPEGDYWDYNIVKPQFAALVNREGLFKCGKKVIYNGPDRFGIVHSGDLQKVSDVKMAPENFHSEDFTVFLKKDEKNARTLYSSFGINNGFHNVTSKKRVRVYVLGEISPYGTPYFSDCASAMDVNFVIRCEAQKKNFWGKFRYTSNFAPTLQINNGTASYGYNHYDYGCNEPTSVVHDSGLTACFRSSPFSLFQTSTNNGFFCVRPDGTYFRSITNGYFYDIFVSDYDFDDFDYAGVGTLPVSNHGFPSGWSHLVHN